MVESAKRVAADLSAYPDLVVIYLGMRVKSWRGVASIFGIGRPLGAIARNKPDGLLAHESMFYSFTNVGFRQYWRDLESLEAFTRSAPHKDWWARFSKDRDGVGFWHETYRKAGGMEAIYLGMEPVGLGRFAPALQPVGAAKTARGRLAA